MFSLNNFINRLGRLQDLSEEIWLVESCANLSSHSTQEFWEAFSWPNYILAFFFEK